MKTEEILKELKKIIEPIHTHSDQMLAISHWISEEFEVKRKPYIADMGRKPVFAGGTNEVITEFVDKIKCPECGSVAVGFDKDEWIHACFDCNHSWIR